MQLKVKKSEGNAKQKQREGKGIPEDHVKQVEDYFNTNEEAHLREASRDLGFSVKKIWIILRRILKWKAYTPFLSACLSKNNKKVRVQSSEWFLTKNVFFLGTRLYGQIQSILF